jgi:hypothetical protein
MNPHDHVFESSILNELIRIGKERRKQGTPMSNKEESGVLLSEIATQKLHWLWEKRILLGKLTILDGDPGLGKSLITLDLAARVTTGGAMPDGTPGVLGGVVLIALEDGVGDTIKPRLELAGGNPSRLLLLNLVKSTIIKTERGYELPFMLPGNLNVLEECISRMQARLVIIDPLMAVLEPTINAFRDQQMRQVLTPLARLAERTDCAILIVRHLNKGSSENPLYRGGGSIGIIAAARTGLMVVKDPEDSSRRILATSKNNLSERADNLTYTIVGNEEGIPSIQWLGVNHYALTTLMGGGKKLSGERQAILRILKESTHPLGPKEVAERTGQDYDGTRHTLRSMLSAGEIASPMRGQYVAPSSPQVPAVNDGCDVVNDVNDVNGELQVITTANCDVVNDVNGESQAITIDRTEPIADASWEDGGENVNCFYKEHHKPYWYLTDSDRGVWGCPICDSLVRRNAQVGLADSAMYTMMILYPPQEGEGSAMWHERIRSYTV